MSNSRTATEKTTAKTSRQSQNSKRQSKTTVPGDNMTTNGTDNKNTDNGGQVVTLTAPAKEAKASASLALTKPAILLPGNRPVDPSNLEIAETVNMAGIRPIFASDLKITETLNSSGERPIFASDLPISGTLSIMGNRPIAPNNIEDVDALMGYLD